MATGPSDYETEFGYEDEYLEEKRTSLLDTVRENLQKEGKVQLKLIFSVGVNHFPHQCAPYSNLDDNSLSNSYLRRALKRGGQG